MIPSPDLIHYACIARGTTVLAEFNSKDAALGAVAADCLARTPPHHASFTHTVRSRTHAFLIDAPFVYFAICDARLDNSDVLAFLRSTRDSSREVLRGGGRRRLEKLTSHCFQGEFNPVFRQLLGPDPYHADGIGSPSVFSGPGEARPRPKVSAVSKMKNRLLGKMRLDGGSNDENGGSGIGLSREFPVMHHNKNGEISMETRKVWKKHVWIVLSLDVAICGLLFGVWLWVCSGLQCMDS